MEEYQLIRKWLAVGIILLFVGVTIAPTINFNTVKASIDDDLVEVTTQACGIQGYGDTTVKLTREQYQNLEEYLVEFQARLNQTTAREEAVPLFKDAVVELDKYGLLPAGMSVERAQRLVTVKKLNSLDMFLEKRYKNSDNSSLINAFCMLFAVLESAEFIFQCPLLVLLLIYNGNYWLFPHIIEFIVLLMYGCSQFPGISLLSAIEFYGILGSIHSLGILGRVNYQFNHKNMLLWGFIGLRLTITSMPFNPTSEGGFIIGWAIEVYKGRMMS